jgi:hypothetical protein
MKTAISIPDPIFAAAEQMAAELDMSRSELYSNAVAAYVATNSRDAITEKINTVLAETTGELDPVLVEMQKKVVRADPW